MGVRRVGVAARAEGFIAWEEEAGVEVIEGVEARGRMNDALVVDRV
jgi:hypothetical protein